MERYHLSPRRVSMHGWCFQSSFYLRLAATQQIFSALRTAIWLVSLHASCWFLLIRVWETEAPFSQRTLMGGHSVDSLQRSRTSWTLFSEVRWRVLTQQRLQTGMCSVQQWYWLLSYRQTCTVTCRDRYRDHANLGFPPTHPQTTTANCHSSGLGGDLIYYWKTILLGPHKVVPYWRGGLIVQVNEMACIILDVVSQ